MQGSQFALVGDLVQDAEGGKFPIPLSGMPLDARKECLPLEPAAEGGDIHRFAQAHKAHEMVRQGVELVEQFCLSQHGVHTLKAIGSAKADTANKRQDPL